MRIHTLLSASVLSMLCGTGRADSDRSGSGIARAER